MQLGSPLMQCTSTQGLVVAKPFRPHGRERSTQVDFTFFETWSPNLAWLLGYLWGDGSITHKHIRMRCAENDVELLHQIKAATKSIHKIIIDKYPREIRCPQSGLTYIGAPLARLVISSTKLSRILQTDYGIRPNKSNMNYPMLDVPEHVLPHFARGQLDSDGCVSINNRKGGHGQPVGCVKFMGSPLFIEKLRDLICKQLDFPLQTLYEKNKGRTREFQFNRRIQHQRLYDWMYPPGEYIYLKRKKTKLEELLSYPVSHHKNLLAI